MRYQDEYFDLKLDWTTHILNGGGMDQNILIIIHDRQFCLGILRSYLIPTKAVTYDEWPKMKRYTRKKAVLFLRKKFFCRLSPFIFSCSS